MDRGASPDPVGSGGLMRLIGSRIPPESEEIAIWIDLDPSAEDTGEEIDTVCNLHHLNQHECRVTKAKGVLSDEVNVAIGLYALSKGYHVMHYEVAAGSKSSRRGVYQKTINGMDYYIVDLVAEAATL